MRNNISKYSHKNINDRLVGKLVFWAILLYVIGYGLLVSKGFQVGEFSIIYLSILLPIFLTDSIRTLIEVFIPGKFYTGREDLTKVTVVIPTLNGGEVLEKTIIDLLRRFAPKNIIVASNGSTDNTCEMARSYGVRVLDIKDPISKVPAINAAMHMVKTEYCLIMDDDTLIGDASIPTQALEDGYHGVAFRVFPIVNNWITKIQMYEYKKSMDIGKRFHNKKGTVQNISGAIGLFPTIELTRQIALHTGEFSGEDLQRTLLIHINKQTKGVVVADSIIETEAPDQILALFKQRVYGWYPGLMSNLGKYIKILFKKNVPFFLRYDAFYNSFLVILGDPLRLISLPIIIFYPWYFVVMYFVYVLVELFPYFALGRKDPFWIVLISPFYGLFGFITRVCATAVFFYRRITVLMAKSILLDDYRHVNLATKLSGVMMSSFVVVFFLTSFLTVRAGVYVSEPEVIAYITPLPTRTPTPTLNPEPVITSVPRPTEYTYTITPGMSHWHFSKIAVNAYSKDLGIELSPAEHKAWSLALYNYLPRTSLTPGEELTITVEDIISVL